MGRGDQSAEARLAEEPAGALAHGVQRRAGRCPADARPMPGPARPGAARPTRSG